MTPLRVEEASLNAWPALNSFLYDGWLLRFADGYTKRANSVNPVFPGSLDLEQKIAYCEALYRRQKLRPVFRLTTVNDLRQLDELLAAKNYNLIDRTKVQVCKLTNVVATASPRTEILEGDEGLRSWLNAFHTLNPQRVDDVTHEKMLRQILGSVAPMVMTIDGEVVACGLGVLESHYLGLFDIVTATEHRRKGYALELTESLLSWGRDLGAHIAYLQVMESNQAAINLYNKLGFHDLYRYWYRVL